MFKINGKDGTLSFIEVRSFMRNWTTIPLWIIKNYKIIRIPGHRKKLNWALGFGYVIALSTILWIVLRIDVQAWLFFGTYITGALLILLKRIDDKRLAESNYMEGEEVILLETEIGQYLVECGTECTKLVTFLDTYINKKEKTMEESTDI